MDAKSVIKGLNDIHAVACGLGDDECYLNSIGIKQLQTLIDGATELLKAQEPRVMTLEEVQQWDGAFMLEVRDKYGVTLTWASYYAEYEHCGEIVCRMINTDGEVNDRVSMQYRFLWRCWTRRPSDEQREAEPWK